jgi:tRNA modification GTPase
MLKLQAAEDTIVAIATPPGRGAVALIRISGPQAFAIGRQILDPWPDEARHAVLCTVRHNADVLDRAVVVLFEKPASFTGEDTVEISTHGGQLVPMAVVSAMIALGARQARPGEFTQRAVLNGKLDILQAEAVADLVDARSTGMHRAALAQLDGGLSRRLSRLRDQLLELEALIAYYVDFPEEDDGPIPRARIEYSANEVTVALKSLLATAASGELIREGALVVIAGSPNVGKSSLFNAVLGRSRAIVTDIPGTTRDALEAVVDSGKWPIRLVDTAGLRSTDDELERLGIEVSERYLADAEIVLACGETAMGIKETVHAIMSKTQAVIIPVRTKADLVAEGDQRSRSALAVSAITGAGVRELLGAVNRVISDQHGTLSTEQPILTRARHREAISSACREADLFLEVWRRETLPATIAGVHVRTAISYLEELIGAVGIEDILDRVFSSFCVGK